MNIKIERSCAGKVPEYIEIKPRPGWHLIDFKELWRYHELIGFFIWRDIKVRYKQTVLGVLWAILQPFTQMIIFSVIFGRIAGIDSEGYPYPVFVYAGLLPWQFFHQAVSRSSNSVVMGAQIFTKVYFPRLILPIAPVGAAILDFGISFFLLIALMFYYGIAPTVSILMIPVLVLFTIFVVLGIGTFLSALNTAYRDFRYIIPFMITIWMYLTPVIYPITAIPERWRWVLMLNPMSGLVNAYRSAILGKPFDWGGLGISMAVGTMIFCLGILYFNRIESRFADIV
jgi:homopolymeric O-antigen transport system permease protein